MNTGSLSKKLLNAPYVIWSILFIIVPLIIVAYYSFTSSDGSFTFNNIIEFFKNDYYLSIFEKSALYALIATAICLLIGYPFAYCMTKFKINSQYMIMLLVMLPMWMNLVVRTYSWSQIFENNGIINNFLTSIGLEKIEFLNTPGVVIFGMVYNYLPFMILPIYSVVSKVDNSLLEAASDLGSNSFSKLKRIILPMSIPGIISGVTMVFVPSISTFYISNKLSNGMIVLVGDVIENKFYKSSDLNYNMGATISLILMVMILVCMVIMNRISDDEDGGVMI